MPLDAGAAPKDNETHDTVSLRISARVFGQFIGTGKEISDETSKNKIYMDSYSTSYTSVTQWKVLDLDQANDVAVLELVSDRNNVSGTGQGFMNEVTKRIVYEAGNKKRTATDTVSSNWTYQFPGENHPGPDCPS